MSYFWKPNSYNVAIFTEKQSLKMGEQIGGNKELKPTAPWSKRGTPDKQPGDHLNIYAASLARTESSSSSIWYDLYIKTGGTFQYTFMDT